MDIKDFTLEELKNELIRRDEEERRKHKPTQLENPDLTGLRRAVAEYIDSIYNGDHHEDSDDTHYIYEEALKAIYGTNIFYWIRKNE